MKETYTTTNTPQDETRANSLYISGVDEASWVTAMRMNFSSILCMSKTVGRGNLGVRLSGSVPTLVLRESRHNRKSRVVSETGVHVFVFIYSCDVTSLVQRSQSHENHRHTCRFNSISMMRTNQQSAIHMVAT